MNISPPYNNELVMSPPYNNDGAFIDWNKQVDFSRPNSERSDTPSSRTSISPPPTHIPNDFCPYSGERLAGMMQPHTAGRSGFGPTLPPTRMISLPVPNRGTFPYSEYLAYTINQRSVFSLVKDPNGIRQPMLDTKHQPLFVDCSTGRVGSFSRFLPSDQAVVVLIGMNKQDGTPFLKSDLDTYMHKIAQRTHQTAINQLAQPPVGNPHCPPPIPMHQMPQQQMHPTPSMPTYLMPQQTVAGNPNPMPPTQQQVVPNWNPMPPTQQQVVPNWNPMPPTQQQVVPNWMVPGW